MTTIPRKRHAQALLALVLSTMGCQETPTTDATASSPGHAIAGAARPVVLATHSTGAGDERYVTAVAVLSDRIYVGTRKGLKVLRWDPSARSISSAGEVPGRPKVLAGAVTSLCVADRRLLASTDDGWLALDGDAVEYEEMGKVTAIASAGGTLFCGRQSGLERRQGREWVRVNLDTVVRNRNSAQRIRALGACKDGTLWIGTEFGIVSLETGKGKWGPHQYGDYQDVTPTNNVVNERGNCNLAGNVVERIACDPESGKVLIATQFGLTVHDGKDFESFTGNHEVLGTDLGGPKVSVQGNVPLPSAATTAAVMAGGALWIATTGGLARLVGKDLTLVEGLPSPTVTALARDPASKILIVGTEEGIAVVSTGDA